MGMKSTAELVVRLAHPLFSSLLLDVDDGKVDGDLLLPMFNACGVQSVR
jgi:hypothetical protein